MFKAIRRNPSPVRTEVKSFFRAKTPGKVARLQWPQPCDKLTRSIIGELTAAAYYFYSFVRESQVWPTEAVVRVVRIRVSRVDSLLVSRRGEYRFTEPGSRHGTANWLSGIC